MSLVIAIQMDPIETINIDADSTFVMALEAQRRGHTLYHYLPRHLTLRQNRLTARARPLRLKREYGTHWEFGPWEVLDLSAVDVILMRQDPPFDLSYITATHLLEHVQPKVLVTNDPAQVRNAPEKLFVTRFPDLMPPTLISSDVEEITAFRAEHRDIVIKPLFGNGGYGVFHLPPGDENLGAVLEVLGKLLVNEPVMVQKYLPEVRAGDKRIILFEGEVAGAIDRVPAEGDARANLHVGGTARATPLTARDREICAAIGPILKEKGLLFTGIDVIGGWLTEINVTSPTGIQQINRLTGARLEETLIDCIEARAAALKG